MVDFLKANPFVTLEEYKWGLSVPMIHLMSMDYTRIHYISDKQKQKRDAAHNAINSAEDLLADLGVPLSVLENNDKPQLNNK